VHEAVSREQWGQLRADVSRLVAHRLPTRADVEDVVQEVLLRVWKHGARVRDGERFGAWLSRVAYTAAADHMRARQRHPVSRYEPTAGDEAPEAPSDTGEEGPEAKELIAAVLRPFIAALPPRYREAVALSELEGHSHAAIAERLGVSVSAVKSRVQRGRDQLRQMLERCCEIGLDARGAPVSCELRPDGRLPPGCCCGDAAPGGRAPATHRATGSRAREAMRLGRLGE
jgi:RNA polymerase sigma-70 factor (ECF subfamily)